MTEDKKSKELSGLGSYWYWIYIVVLSFLFIVFIGINTKSNIPFTLDSFRKFRYAICFGVFAMIISISNFIISNPNVCGKFDFKKGVLLALFPFIFIFGLGVMVLEFVFPGWIRGFSNTFGMLFVNLADVKGFLQQYMNKEQEFSKFYDDPIPMFKEITTDGFALGENNQVQWDQVDKLVSNNVFSGLNDKDRNQFMITLYNYVMSKDAVSYCIWYILLGIITIQTTILMILNNNDCLRGAKDNKSFSKFMKTSK
jgi:hypothetical protein